MGADLKQNPRAAMVVRALAFCVLFALGAADPAHAIFEKYNLYGLGANATSLGAPAIPSRFDTLCYLTNPAMITDVYSKNYTFAMGRFTSDLNPEMDYKYSLYSYTVPQRRAYSTAFTEDGGVQRKLATYTFGSRSDNMSYGLNLSGYKFDVNGADTSGFSMDLGIVFFENEQIQYGLAIQNFVTSTSATDIVEDQRISQELSQRQSLGLRYRMNRNMDVSLSWNKIKADPSNPSLEDRDSSSIVLGFEYSIPNSANVRVTGIREKETFAEDTEDKLMVVGAGYRTPQYDMSYTVMNKNNTFSSASAMTLTYKAGGAWDPPPTPVAAVDTELPEIKELTFEEPLPTLELAMAPELILAQGGDPDAESAPAPVTEKEPPAVTGNIEVSNVNVMPRAILIPSPTQPAFNDISGHWSEPFVNDLSEAGFFANAKDQKFRPGASVERAEFYRMLFLLQLSRLFSEPVTVLFSLDKPARAVVTLNAPHLGNPVKLVSGEYEKSGDKRIQVTRDMFAKAGVIPGRYMLRVMLTAGEDQGVIEEYVTILDSSIDFSDIEPLKGDERKAKVAELKGRLSNLGLNLDYLDALAQPGDVTRMNALEAVLAALGAAMPSGAGSEPVFADTLALTDAQRDLVFLGSRALDSLNGEPLVFGYEDMTFRPQQPLNRAEAAALIRRAMRTTPADFKAPFKAPASFTHPVIAEKPPTTDKPDEDVSKPEPEETPQPLPDVIYRYIVVAKSFLMADNATKAVEKLGKKGQNAWIIMEKVGLDTIHHVVVGAFDSNDDAHAMAAAGLSGYTLKVKRVVLTPEEVKAAPRTPRAPQLRPGLQSEREVELNIDNKTSF